MVVTGRLPEPTMTAVIERGLVSIVFDARPPVYEVDTAPLPRPRRPRRAGVCTACGEPGHIRSNRRCPEWAG